MIERYFTKPLGSPEENFEWKTVDVEIRNSKTGEIVYEQEGCKFPEHFSQTACNIIASKYFYRGVKENSYNDLIDRMISFWKDKLIESGILSHEEGEIFYDEAYFTLYHQMWAPNSPQWFNTGIYKKYGIKGDSDELYYYDPKSCKVKETKSRYERSQSSACFILSIQDQLIGPNSITDHYITETKLFKGGSGTGSNFSPLRANGEHLSSGGTSSGLMSYLKGLDVNAGTIKSGGTTRRAAKMVIVDIDHPEVEDFIEWKVKEEKKAKVLIEAGYDASIGGEAYSTVAGQNSNNSIRLNEEFMTALEEDTEWTLKGRKDGTVNKTVSARDLFHRIAKAAWECGDPGIQFDDTYNKWNTCKESGRINATNPCSEFAFLDNSACNLSSINLDKFLKDNDELEFEFDLEAYTQVIKIAQLAMESSIRGGQYPTKEIAYNSYKFRPTGLGISNLAAFLNRLGYAYDSEEARAWSSLITSYLTAVSYDISGDMADSIGVFDEYPKNKQSMKEVLYEHIQETFDIDDLEDPKLEFLKEEVLDKWKSAVTHQGYRNAQVSCIAPTGTISLVMDCETTGIEPYYSRMVTKTLADGSVITSENKEVIKTAEEIAPEDHVKMIAALQPFISGGISKTVNLPNTATVEDIENIFKDAYYSGCKSITVYRDGSKGTQVLNKNTVKEQSEESTNDKNKYFLKFPPETKFFARLQDGTGVFTTVKQLGEHTAKIVKQEVEKALEENKHIRQKPNGVRSSRTHAAKIGDIELYITVGYYDNGDISEIFISNDKEGTLVRGLLASLSKSISHQFQNGEKPEEVSKMLRGQKYEPCGVVERHPNIKMASSISDLVSKVIDIELGDYSRVQVKPDVMETAQKIVEKHQELFSPEEERIYGKICPVCGSDHLIQSGNCEVCYDCGSTTGCS